MVSLFTLKGLQNEQVKDRFHYLIAEILHQKTLY